MNGPQLFIERGLKAYLRNLSPGLEKVVNTTLVRHALEFVDGWKFWGTGLLTSEHGGLLLRCNQPIHLRDYASQLFVASCELLHRLLEFRFGISKIADEMDNRVRILPPALIAVSIYCV